jgi:methyl-accepting chemotaxis protein
MSQDKYEVRLKNQNSLKFRVTLFFIFFFVAIFGVFIITSVLQVNAVTRYLCSQIALPTVEQARLLIDGDAFEALSKSLDESDPYYDTTRLQLLELKESINCQYLYTMAPVEASLFRYIIDGSAPPEDAENFSAMGDEEDIGMWDVEAMAAFTTKTTKLGRIDQNEEWGASISAYSPIINSRGEAVGIVGCDLDATEIIRWIRTQVLWQLAVVIVTILLGLIVYISLLRRINRSFV